MMIEKSTLTWHRTFISNSFLKRIIWSNNISGLNSSFVRTKTLLISSISGARSNDESLPTGKNVITPMSIGNCWTGERSIAGWSGKYSGQISIKLLKRWEEMERRECMHTFLDRLNWKYSMKRQRNSSGEILQKPLNVISPVAR